MLSWVSSHGGVEKHEQIGRASLNDHRGAACGWMKACSELDLNGRQSWYGVPREKKSLRFFLLDEVGGEIRQGLNFSRYTLTGLPASFHPIC